MPRSLFLSTGHRKAQLVWSEGSFKTLRIRILGRVGGAVKLEEGCSDTEDAESAGYEATCRVMHSASWTVAMLKPGLHKSGCRPQPQAG